MEEAAVLSPCTKSLSSSISLARSCSPQRLFLILNSTAREWKSFRTCFVWVWFALSFFFSLFCSSLFFSFKGLRDDANQIPNESSSSRGEAASVCLPAITNNNNNNNNKYKYFRKLLLAAQICDGKRSCPDTLTLQIVL